MRYEHFVSEKLAIILVFAACVAFRTLPELAAYPYPIGYDVVNYYIPVVSNFDAHWPTISTQFPLYSLVLHFLSLLTMFPAQAVVSGMAVAMFGAFGISLFCIGRSLLKLSRGKSIFLAFFTLFQMAVLRTGWDLHKDIFALTAIMFAFCLLGRRDPGSKWLAVTISIAAIAVSADRMMGALFCLSLTAYAVARPSRNVILTCTLAVGIFAILLSMGYSRSTGIADVLGASLQNAPTFYNSQNLLVLFSVVDGVLVAPAIIGFLHMKSILLKIPLLISLGFSFSWLVFPNVGILLADRWIIIGGIFLSIFAGFGVLQIIDRLRHEFQVTVAGFVIVVILAVGLGYALMPYDEPFFLYGISRGNIEEFSPVSMQFNSLDIKDNGKLLSTIEWINHNTERDAVIIGEKHWRGFMELHLEGERAYLYSDNPKVLAETLDKRGDNVYLLEIDDGSRNLFRVREYQSTQ